MQGPIFNNLTCLDHLSMESDVLGQLKTGPSSAVTKNKKKTKRQKRYQAYVNDCTDLSPVACHEHILTGKD